MAVLEACVTPVLVSLPATRWGPGSLDPVASGALLTVIDQAVDLKIMFRPGTPREARKGAKNDSRKNAPPSFAENHTLFPVTGWAP